MYSPTFGRHTHGGERFSPPPIAFQPLERTSGHRNAVLAPASSLYSPSADFTAPRAPPLPPGRSTQQAVEHRSPTPHCHNGPEHALSLLEGTGQPHIDPEDIPRILDMQRKVEAQIAERRAGRAAWRRDWRQFAKRYGGEVQEKCEIWMGLDKEVERSTEHIEEVIRRMEDEQRKLGSPNPALQKQARSAEEALLNLRKRYEEAHEAFDAAVRKANHDHAARQRAHQGQSEFSDDEDGADDDDEELSNHNPRSPRSPLRGPSGRYFVPVISHAPLPDWRREERSKSRENSKSGLRGSEGSGYQWRLLHESGTGSASRGGSGHLAASPI